MHKILRLLVGASAVLAASATFAGTPLLPARGSSSASWIALHNQVRANAGQAPLAWDPALAANAQDYADRLAESAQLRHSDRSERPGQGENLWMGTRGAFAPTQMVGSWASEKGLFRPGRFPAVSVNGDWASVGHYTQMIWPGTQRVGCAVGRSARVEVLVCRYFPAGNVIGRPVP